MNIDLTYFSEDFYGEMFVKSLALVLVCKWQSVTII